MSTDASLVEPVEESAGRSRAATIQEAIAAIAALGPIPAERWVAELERLGQSAEGSGD